VRCVRGIGRRVVLLVRYGAPDWPVEVITSFDQLQKRSVQQDETIIAVVVESTARLKVGDMLLDGARNQTDRSRDGFVVEGALEDLARAAEAARGRRVGAHDREEIQYERRRPWLAPLARRADAHKLLMKVSELFRRELGKPTLYCWIRLHNLRQGF
jgi:hypothetical protein